MRIDLKLIIKNLGDEKEATKIAKNIVKHRNIKKITSTSDLVKIIEKVKKKNLFNKINPCTKTFQALRIFVNKEVTELINGIISATKKLKPGGIILVISFHSLEDKIIKYFLQIFLKINLNLQGIYPRIKLKRLLYLINTKIKL